MCHRDARLADHPTVIVGEKFRRPFNELNRGVLGKYIVIAERLILRPHAFFHSCHLALIAVPQRSDGRGRFHRFQCVHGIRQTIKGRIEVVHFILVIRVLHSFQKHLIDGIPVDCEIDQFPHTPHACKRFRIIFFPGFFELFLIFGKTLSAAFSKLFLD